MSMNRKMKRFIEKEKRKMESKPLGQKLSPGKKKLAERIEQDLIKQGETIGHLKGMTEATEIYKQRFLNDVSRIDGIGPKRLPKIARALGFIEIAEELEKKL